MLRGRGCGHAGARATAGTPGTAGTTGKKGRAGADFSSLESLRSLPSLFALGPWSRLSVSKPWPPLRLRASRKGPSETQRRRYRSGADACRREADRPRRKADGPDSGRTVHAGFREAPTPAAPIRLARRTSHAERRIPPIRGGRRKPDSARHRLRQCPSASRGGSPPPSALSSAFQAASEGIVRRHPRPCRSGSTILNALTIPTTLPRWSRSGEGHYPPSGPTLKLRSCRNFAPSGAGFQNRRLRRRLC